MKKGLILFGAAVILAMSATSVSAYDGGSGGFPPGHTGNPHPRYKFVCEFVKKELPNNKLVWLPRCRLAKTKANAEYARDMRERIRELIARLWQGYE